MCGESRIDHMPFCCLERKCSSSAIPAEMSFLSKDRGLRVTFFLLLVVCMTACGSYQIEFEQKVHVALLDADRPMRSVTFGLFNSAKCEGLHATAATDEFGVANISRVALRGKYAVLVETITLCENVEGTWQLLWSATMDPPDELILECKGAVGPRTCRDSRDIWKFDRK